MRGFFFSDKIAYTIRMIKTTTIKQSCVLPATPQRVYDMFLSSKEHTAFTGDDAAISPIVGGEFSVFSGWATGKNLELVPGKKIVQTWHASDWPTGHTSTISIQLTPAPNNQTKLAFVQDNVPASFAKSVAQGWRDYYWGPMAEALAE